MKTLKIILAVLLLISLLPVTGCTFTAHGSITSMEEELSSISILHLTKEEKSVLPDVLEQVSDLSLSLSVLSVLSFIFILSAGIIAIKWKHKYYGAFTAGILLLISFLWNSSLQKNIQDIASRIKNVATTLTLNSLESLTQFENTSALLFANVMLFIPMAALIIIGVFELIIHFVAGKKSASTTAETINISIDSESSYPQSATPVASNIDELKQYKDLFDQGIITQEEFDAKRKQLLGL